MRYLPLLVILLSLVTISTGCSTSSELAQARQSYNQAFNDAEVVKNAPATLGDAAIALHQAENARTLEEQRHYAYIAQRNVELARMEAAKGQSEMEIAELQRERNQQLAALQRLEDEATLRAYRAETSKEVEQFKEPLFGFDKVLLTADDIENLKQVSSFLRNNPDYRVLVEGFTDSIGSKDYNLSLGTRRAEAVAQKLAAEGISSERIVIRGVGEAFPVADNNTPAGRQLNRRAEITILTSAQPPEEAGK